VIEYAHASSDVLCASVDSPLEPGHYQGGLGARHSNLGIEPRAIRRNFHFVASGIRPFAVDVAGELYGRCGASRVWTEVKSFPVFVVQVVIDNPGVADAHFAQTSWTGDLLDVDTEDFFNKLLTRPPGNQPRCPSAGVGDGALARGVRPFPLRVFAPAFFVVDWLEQVLLARGG